MKPPTLNCALSQLPRESSVALKVTLSVVVIAASYSLLAWFLNIPHLLQINPSSPPMSPSTAVCFLLLSSTLFLGYFRRQINFARCCAVGCAIISALSVSQYATGERNGLDTLFIQPFLLLNSGHVERMTLDSGLAFILSSFAFLTFARRNSFIRCLLAGVLVTLAGTMSITALFVYALDLGSVEGLGGFGRMSPLSALCHELIALSLLAQIDMSIKKLPRYFRYWHPTISALSGVSISLSIWAASTLYENRALSVKLDRSAEARTAVIQNEINSNLNTLVGVERFFSNSQFVSPEEFRNFVLWEFHGQNSLVSIDWAPNVQARDRESWEMQHSRQISRVSSVKKLEPRFDDMNYFPVTYSAPPDLLLKVKGYDHSSDNTLKKVMEDAAKSRQPRSTEPFRLFRLSAGDNLAQDFLIFIPVIQPNTKAESLTSTELRGFVVGVFSLPKLVEHALRDMPALSPNLHFSTEVDGKLQEIFTHCTKFESDCKETGNLSRATKITIAGRTWILHFNPTVSYVTQQQTTFPITILVASLLLTATSSLYMLSISKKRDALRASNEQFRLLVEGVQDYAIFALDIQGIIVTWNAGAERNKGYTASEVIGRHFSIFYLPEDISKNKPAEELTIAQREGRFEEEGIRIKKDGSQFWAHVLITPIYGDDGALRGYSKVTRDISARKAVDDILREQNSLLVESRAKAEKAKEEALAATNAKSLFVANVSHEIRTPLTSIIGFTEEVLRSALSKEERNLQLGVVLRNARHLLSIINDILDLSKIEAGKLDLEIRDVSIIDIMEEIAILMTPKALQKNLKLSFENHYPLPKFLRTDPTRLKQIIFNLVDNAIKFTKEGSVEVSISCNIQEAQLQIEVTDTGIGMTEEQMKKVFCSFTQGDSSINREFGGTGLGLFISRQIARSLNGDITLKSNSIRGSVFTASISVGPLANVELLYNESQSSALANEDSVAVRGFSGKILLAEDVPDTQKLLSMILREHGVEVTVAGNGKEALAMASNAHFDLIFMDMQMPIMDGITATKLLRGGGYYGPIVALTANVVQGKVDECIMAGCDGCLGKPFERSSLGKVMSLYLSATDAPSTSTPNELFQNTKLEFRRLFSQHLAKLRRAYKLNDFKFIKTSSHALAGAAAFAYPQVCKITV